MHALACLRASLYDVCPREGVSWKRMNSWRLSKHFSIIKLTTATTGKGWTISKNPKTSFMESSTCHSLPLRRTYRVFESNRDYVAWLGHWAGWGQLLLSGSVVLKWLKDAVFYKRPKISVPYIYQNGLSPRFPKHTSPFCSLSLNFSRI